MEQSAVMIQLLVNKVRDLGIKGCENAAQDEVAEVNIGGGHQLRWDWLRHRNIDPMFEKRIDFNTTALELESGSVDIAICEQVIEHLHNTTFFLGELNRILGRNKMLFISSENLASLPNLLALSVGMTPFSLQPCCGEFRGGFKRGPVNPDCDKPINHPCYSGMRGHVRVMTKRQMRELLEAAGFEVLRVRTWAFNHYMLFVCRKK